LTYTEVGHLTFQENGGC